MPQTDEAGRTSMKRFVTTAGRMLIAECLPKSHKVPFETVNRLLTKKEIGDVIDTVYRHTGYWATVASYAPALDVALAAVVTQRDGKALLGELEKRVLNLARTAQGEERAAGER